MIVFGLRCERSRHGVEFLRQRHFVISSSPTGHILRARQLDTKNGVWSDAGSAEHQPLESTLALKLRQLCLGLQGVSYLS